MDESTRKVIEEKRQAYVDELNKFIPFAQKRIGMLVGAIQAMDNLLKPGEEDGEQPGREDRKD